MGEFVAYESVVDFAKGLGISDTEMIGTSCEQESLLIKSQEQINDKN